jgi:hypothetical protein
MKEWIGVLVLAGMMVSGQAGAVMNCQEADQLGASLTELGVTLEDENTEIGEGSEEDNMLAEISVNITDIAAAAEDEDLANAGASMAEAWAANDRDAFLDAMADVVNQLDEAMTEAGCE